MATAGALVSSAAGRCSISRSSFRLPAGASRPSLAQALSPRGIGALSLPRRRAGVLARAGGDGSGPSSSDEKGGNKLVGKEGKEANEKIIPDALDPFRNDPAAKKMGKQGMAGAPDRSEGPSYEFQGVSVPVVNPKFSYFFFASNFVVYGCLAITGLLFGDRQFDVLVASLANDHQQVWGGDYGRLLTSNWLFPGWLSLTLNSLALTQVGPEVEALYGYTRYNYMAVLVGIGGGVASCAAKTTDISYGGPGILIGLIGALSVYVYRHGAPKWLPSQVAFVLAVVAFDIAGAATGVDGVDVFNLLGALLSGMLLAWGLGPSWDVIKVDMEEGAGGSEGAQGIVQDSIRWRDQIGYGLAFNGLMRAGKDAHPISDVVV